VPQTKVPKFTFFLYISLFYDSSHREPETTDKNDKDNDKTTASKEAPSNHHQQPVPKRRTLATPTAMYDGSTSEKDEQEEAQDGPQSKQNETLDTVDTSGGDQTPNGERQNSRDPPVTNEENQRVPLLDTNMRITFLWKEQGGHNVVVTYYRMSDGTTWQQKYHPKINTYLFQHVNADGSVYETTARQPRCI
jgi:hypothetical protein